MNYKSIISSCFLFGVLLLLPGCATIIHGTSQKLTVATHPSGAVVSDGVQNKLTPAVIELKRKRDHVLTISKPGYETAIVPITHVVSGAVAANILGFGFIGWGVDAITGAQWELVPETVSVVLRPLRPWETDKNASALSTSLPESQPKKAGS